MIEPTEAQLAIARRVGNRLSEKLPSQGVMDWTDVQQFALEALLKMLAAGDVPERPAYLSAELRFRTIDLLREHGVMERAKDGEEPFQPEQATLDDLSPRERDALLATEDEEFGLDGRKSDNRTKGWERSRRAQAQSRKAVLNDASRGRQRLLRSEPTERELRSLALYADGLTYPLIASELGITLAAVKNNLKNCYARMGARSGAHAVAMAFRRGLIS